MAGTPIVELLASEGARDEVEVNGWARTRRDSKSFFFMELNDGSCLKGLQVVVADSVPGYAELKAVTTGAAVSVRGKLVASQGKGQEWEVQATGVEMLGLADESFPLQKKRHSLEFLREMTHLRPRTNLFGAVFRVRSRLSFAIHSFFQERGFFYVNTPIITGSDCEGAGELFRVSALDFENLPRGEGGSVDFAKDFFAKPKPA